MKEIKLSIIVPVYNVEQYLDECIQSLLNQTLKNIEIILVDDGSPDNSPQMCDEYAKQDSRIKVIHKVNRGLGYARNSGLEISQGEYVTFIDSDDYIDLKAYKTVCELMDSENLDELRFSCNRFKNDKSHSPLKYTSHPIIISDKKNIELIALCIFDTPKQKYAIYEWGGSSCMAVFR